MLLIQKDKEVDQRPRQNRHMNSYVACPEYAAIPRHLIVDPQNPY